MNVRCEVAVGGALGEFQRFNSKWGASLPLIKLAKIFVKVFSSKPIKQRMRGRKQWEQSNNISFVTISKDVRTTRKMSKNFHVTLAKRPGVEGTPALEHFTHSECPYPDDCGVDEVVVKSLYLSVDPIQRNMMNEETGLPIFASYQVGCVIKG